MYWRGIITALLWVGLAAAAVAEACPGCNAAVAERTSSTSPLLAAGFYWSILFLLAVPLLLVTGTTWMLIRSARRHAARRALRTAHASGMAAHDA